MTSTPSKVHQSTKALKAPNATTTRWALPIFTRYPALWAVLLEESAEALAVPETLSAAAVPPDDKLSPPEGAEVELAETPGATLPGTSVADARGSEVEEASGSDVLEANGSEEDAEESMGDAAAGGVKGAVTFSAGSGCVAFWAFARKASNVFAPVVGALMENTIPALQCL